MAQKKKYVEIPMEFGTAKVTLAVANAYAGVLWEASDSMKAKGCSALAQHYSELANTVYEICEKCGYYDEV